MKFDEQIAKFCHRHGPHVTVTSYNGGAQIEIAVTEEGGDRSAILLDEGEWHELMSQMFEHGGWRP